MRPIGATFQVWPLEGATSVCLVSVCGPKSRRRELDLTSCCVTAVSNIPPAPSLGLRKGTFHWKHHCPWLKPTQSALLLLDDRLPWGVHGSRAAWPYKGHKVTFAFKWIVLIQLLLFNRFVFNRGPQKLFCIYLCVFLLFISSNTIKGRKTKNTWMYLKN